MKINLDVALGVFCDSERRILMTQRGSLSPQPGRWEFPGGKVEPEETAVDALVREMHEELGVRVIDYRYLDHVVHSYPAHEVNLAVYHVTGYEGEPRCCETQSDLRWLNRDAFGYYHLLHANYAVLRLLHREGIIF